MKHILAFVSVVFFLTTAHTQEMPPNLRTNCPSHVLGHTNGIWTTSAQATQNLLYMSVDFPDQINGYPVEYELFYNRSGIVPSEIDYINDLIESFIIVVSEQSGVSWSDFVPFITRTPRSQADPEIPSGLNDLLASALRSVASSLSINVQNPSAELLEALTTNLQKVRTFLHEGKRPTIVAHSQGNFIANEIYRRIAVDLQRDDVPGLKIVGVATPASSVAGNADNTAYVTADIDFIRFAVGALTPNVSFIFSPLQRLRALALDPLGHSFIHIYLNPDLPLKANVHEKIYWAIGSQVPNCLFVPVSPNGFYFQNYDPGPSAPTLVNLVDIGAHPGTRIRISKLGDFYFELPGLATSDFLGAAFLSSPGSLPISPGSGSDSRPIESLCSDIADDFEVLQQPYFSTVTVPENASLLALGPPDCPHYDNAVGPSGLFGATLLILPPIADSISTR